MSRMQCFTITQSGSRCKRMCQHGSTQCFQHNKMDSNHTSSPNVRPFRQLPSIDFTAETGRPIFKTIDLIDLTLEESEPQPRRMETRLSRRRSIQREIGMVQEAIENTRQQRVKPRPPRRPRKTKSKKHKDSNQKQTNPTHSQEHQKEEDCCICYEQKVREERFLECGHVMCQDCIKQLRSDKCPMCRKEIQSKFISKAEKKRMATRKRDDDEERNEQAYEAYMQALIQETQNTYGYVPFLHQ